MKINHWIDVCDEYLYEEEKKQRQKEYEEEKERILNSKED